MGSTASSLGKETEFFRGIVRQKLVGDRTLTIKGHKTRFYAGDQSLGRASDEPLKFSKGLIAAILLLVIFLVAVAIIGIPAMNSHKISGQTVSQSGIQFKIEDLNRSNTMEAGTRAAFMFNVTSPVEGTVYFGVYTAPTPGMHENFTLFNMTSQTFQLPSGVNVSYPNENALTGTSQAIFQVTISPDVSSGNLSLVFMVLQPVSSSQTSGQGQGFMLTVMT